MFQNGQMTTFCEILDQLQVKLSLELNVIEKNQIFLHVTLPPPLGGGTVTCQLACQWLYHLVCIHCLAMAQLVHVVVKASCSLTV